MCKEKVEREGERKRLKKNTKKENGNKCKNMCTVCVI